MKMMIGNNDNRHNDCNAGLLRSLKILEKSWNLGKKFPGPGKYLNLSRGPSNFRDGHKISFFISKNNKK